MKITNEVGGMAQFGGQQPRRFLVGALIAKPTHQVKQLAVAALAIDLGIENFRNLEFRFTIDLNRWRCQEREPRDEAHLA